MAAPAAHNRQSPGIRLRHGADPVHQRLRALVLLRAFQLRPRLRRLGRRVLHRPPEPCRFHFSRQEQRLLGDPRVFVRRGGHFADQPRLLGPLPAAQLRLRVGAAPPGGARAAAPHRPAARGLRVPAVRRAALVRDSPRRVLTGWRRPGGPENAVQDHVCAGGGDPCAAADPRGQGLDNCPAQAVRLWPNENCHVRKISCSCGHLES
jgi:hypothetical protein